MEKPVVAIVCGTRPEIIKLAPVYHALVAQKWAHVRWIHTGQHREMADDMLACFDIEPEVRLDRVGDTIETFGAHGRMQLDAELSARPADLCVVQGDTESAFIGALAGFYRRIPVAHVEAGLRTHNLARPFPEEGLRQMIGRIATLHFAPTARARAALRHEGIPAAAIELTGNTVVDAQLWACDRYGIARKASGRGHILVTAHRREHWGREMEEMFQAIADIARAHPAQQILFPVHLNPVVQEAAQAVLAGIGNVKLVPPLGYLEMQQALADAFLVLTDSGGIQEEAPTFGVPVLVLRKETERPEAAEAGCALLVGPRRDDIVREVERLMNDELALRRMQQPVNPYGDGHAALRIATTLERYVAGAMPAAVAAAAA